MDTSPPRPLDEVDEASQESFPASDPPSYTPISALQPADSAGPSECYEATFERAVCRIEITDNTTGGVSTFEAVMVVVDAETGRIRPVTLESGERAAIHGRTTSQALSDALTFLGQHFGPPTVYEHGCRELADARPTGEPVVVRETPH